MDRTNSVDDVPTAHGLEYFERMREIAGQAGSASVLHGYLMAADHPAVHFGALCPVGLGLRLSDGCHTETSAELTGVAWVLHQGGLPRLSGQMVLCPDCLHENERVMRQMSQAAAWHEESAADVEIATLFWGNEEDVDRIVLELRRRKTAE